MKLISLLAVAAVAVTVCAQAQAGTILKRGSVGPAVTTLQQDLHASTLGDFYKSGFDTSFGPITENGLKRWQKRAELPVTGQIETGSAAWNKLESGATVFRPPPGIDPRSIAGARQHGWAIDASKSTNKLYVLRYNSANHKTWVAMSTPTSFGGCNKDGCFVTPDGAFPVYRKAGKDEVSREWKDSTGHWAKMPYSLYMVIDGRNSGTAVHYDPLGDSHKCVHIPSWPIAQYLYENFPIGALVVIHR
jgi:peptidoglycan hydrolase-like protein with peptidoglycan-binding domain